MLDLIQASTGGVTPNISLAKNQLFTSTLPPLLGPNAPLVVYLAGGASSPSGFDLGGSSWLTYDELADALEAEEAGVALVGVEHLRMNVERSKCPYSTDPEDDLLAQTVLFVAAVEPIGDGDGFRRVRWHVRVEQVQPDPADVGAPHSHGHRNIGEVDDDFDTGWMQPECVGIDAFVALLLPAVVVEELVEVALCVEQTSRLQVGQQLIQGFCWVGKVLQDIAQVNRIKSFICTGLRK